MRRQTKVLGVVHARGGSKRIPLKNLLPLNGKPLIANIIQAAQASSVIDRLVVSTDHPKIQEVARQYHADVPFVRPPELAEDCPSEWVTQHAVRFVEEEQAALIEIAVTLQPTTPFCRAEDIAKCVKLLRETGADSVWTAVEVEQRPEWMFRVENGWAHPFIEGFISGERGITQSLPKLYVPNGAAYATRRETLMNAGLIIGPNTRLVEMPRELSIDIDEMIDFRFAEFMAQHIQQEANKASS